MSVHLSLVLALVLGATTLSAGTSKPVLNGKIAFVSDRDGNPEIYVMNPDGTAQTRLTNDPADDVDPAWSPDGTRIAFVRGIQIHVMNADGTNVTQLTSRGKNKAPAWSPDGLQIAFHSELGDGGPDIFVMRADGANVTRLTDEPAGNFSPSWSPDGNSIAFACRRLNDAGFISVNVCLMNADGTNIEFLTGAFTGPFDDSPSFSPDGKSIVFARGRIVTERDRVTVMNADGNESGLTWGSTGGFDFFPTHPVFSPDGTKIAFAAEERGETDQSIHIMNADGSSEVQITHNEGIHDNQPSWQRTAPADTTGVYVPSTGKWLLRNSNTSGDPDFVVPFGGQPGDLPVAGDWDGDGRTDLAVFRDGVFVRALLDSLSCIPCQPFVFADAFDEIAFGEPGDLPVAGDWDGDGRDDVGVFRPGKQGTFLLRVPETIPFCPLCQSRGFTTQTVIFGGLGTLPVAGDWNGDGKDEIGFYDPEIATFTLTEDFVEPTFVFAFGQPGRDLPLAGDWTGSFRDGVGVFHGFPHPPLLPTMSLGVDFNTQPEFEFEFGLKEGLPVAGHWTKP